MSIHMLGLFIGAALLFCAGVFVISGPHYAAQFLGGWLTEYSLSIDNLFVIAMLCMSGAGAYMAFIKSQTGNLMGGVMTFYMVATAWATAKRREGKTSVFDWGALLVALAFGAVAVSFGFQAVYSQTGLKGGYPPAVYFVWGLVAVLSAAGDIRMLVRGGVFVGSQRIVRHLWRMCLGLFIASGSFFLGQQKVFPASLRGLKVWFVPAFLPLLFMIFWLIRVRFTNAFKRNASPYQTHENQAGLRQHALLAEQNASRPPRAVAGPPETTHASSNLSPTGKPAPQG
jgi:hypothetical protein